MLRNNIWNRIFHNSVLKEERNRFEECKKLQGFGPETIQFVNAAKTLDELLEAHKIAWQRGYRNANLGPCEYGMFRTNDILNMQPNEVYLGNIWGLWTFNIPYWNAHKDIDMSGNGFGIDEDKKCYDLIMRQYRRLLLSNIEDIIRDAKQYISEYQKINL